MKALQTYSLSHGIYVPSLAEQAPFHRHRKSIIERLIMYIIFTSVNFGHALEYLDRKAGVIIHEELYL